MSQERVRMRRMGNCIRVSNPIRPNAFSDGWLSVSTRVTKPSGSLIGASQAFRAGKAL